MPRISRSALLPYSAERVFALVNDIDAYPQFMDGCVGAKVLERTDQRVTARLELGKAGLRHAFTTSNTLEPPTSMQLQLVEGPFRKFRAHWRFDPLSDSACKVNYEMDFEMAGGLVDAALGLLFESTASDMVNAIARRARQLYGAPAA